MPRRMIDPKIWTNLKIGKLPPMARLLFIGVFSTADDDGRLEADPRFLKATTFPYDEDLKTDMVRELRNACATLGLIRVYSKNNREYLDIPGWGEHQRIRKDRYTPSTLPSFEESDNQPTTTVKPSGNQMATNGHPSIVKSSIVKTSRIPTVSVAPSDKTKAKKPKSRLKPHQQEAGQFLSLVERHEKVPLLSREKLIHLVRTKLFQDPRSTPEKLFEFYGWLKENEFFFRNKAPPQIIGGMPDRYPSWLEGKLKPTTRVQKDTGQMGKRRVEATRKKEDFEDKEW